MLSNKNRMKDRFKLFCQATSETNSCLDYINHYVKNTHKPMTTRVNAPLQFQRVTVTLPIIMLQFRVLTLDEQATVLGKLMHMAKDETIESNPRFQEIRLALSDVHQGLVRKKQRDSLTIGQNMR